MNSEEHVNSHKLFPTQANLHGGEKSEWRLLHPENPNVPKAMNHRHEESSSRVAIRWRKRQKAAGPTQLICEMKDIKSKRQLALSSAGAPPPARPPAVDVHHLFSPPQHASVNTFAFHRPFAPPAHPSPPCVLQCSCERRDGDGGRVGGMEGGPEEESGSLLPRRREN